MNFFKKNQKLQALYKLATSSLYFPPLVVLVAILIITVWPWQNAHQNLQVNSEQASESIIEGVKNSLHERFASYNSNLQSGVALLQANPNLTRDQWHTYYRSLKQTTNPTGIQATGYSRIFPPNQSGRVTDFMKAQGINDFSIYPLEPSSSLNGAVLYLYPTTENNRNAIGFNMLSETNRRQAILKARDTGSPALTNKLTLVQNIKIGDGKGFLLYAPYYRLGSPTETVAQRRANFIGVVYGGFRSQAFFESLVEEPSEQSGYSLKVYDKTVSEENLWYATKNSKDLDAQGNTTKVVRPVSMLGTTWQLEFTFTQNSLVSSSERNAPTYILLVGVVTAFLVFLALLTIFKSRATELQQQKDKEVNLAKDELLSLASHQMRTPATGVKQYLGMVLQGFTGKISDSQKSLLEKAYKSNERQLNVINQILHLAKLEAGRIVLAKHPTNINELITDIADEQHDEISARGHKLKMQLPKKIIKATVDSHMIRMAIENLLSNAIKYTVDPGEIRLKLRQTATHIKISVKDSGIGIEAREFNKIFKQFTRLYDEHTERISGTGIGLYLAEQLVLLHKGTLTVHSSPGKGSEFTISLPKTRVKKQ